MVLSGTFPTADRHPQGKRADVTWTARAWGWDGKLFGVARGCTEADAKTQASAWFARSDVERAEAVPDAG